MEIDFSKRIISCSSPNYDERPEGSPIRWVILHYTALQDTSTSLSWLCDPEKKVSAHYLVCRTGTLYRLVDDHKRAWHAGVSRWKNEENLNHTSIGIEFDNDGYEPYTNCQIHILMELLEHLCKVHSIPRAHILGHQDVAPDRKQDPGSHFPWEILYEQGFALERRDSVL